MNCTTTWFALLSYLEVTVSLWHCGTVTLWHCFTRTHCDTVALWHCDTVSRWHCNTFSQWHCFTVALWHCSALLFKTHCGTLHTIRLSIWGWRMQSINDRKWVAQCTFSPWSKILSSELGEKKLQSTSTCAMCCAKKNYPQHWLSLFHASNHPIKPDGSINFSKLTFLHTWWS